MPVPLFVRVYAASRVAPAGLSWAAHVSFCVKCRRYAFVWVVCMIVAVMEHKHGMWCGAALLAACVLRCVAKS